MQNNFVSKNEEVGLSWKAAPRDSSSVYPPLLNALISAAINVLRVADLAISVFISFHACGIESID